MVSAAVGALHQQQLRAARRGHRGLRPEQGERRHVVGRVVAQRVAVRDRRRERLGERRGLHHLQPHPPQVVRRGRQVRPGHAGEVRPGAQHHEVTAVPAAAPGPAPVRDDLDGLPAGQPLVPRPRPGARAAPGARPAAPRSRRPGSTARRGTRPAAPGSPRARRRGRAARSRAASASGSSAASPSTRSSASRVASVSDPAGRNPVPGADAAISSHSSRARNASASSGPARRPLTQTRPKFRTLAPRASGSRSRCTTENPRRRAMTACIVPSTPPPTITTRCSATDDEYNLYSQLWAMTGRRTSGTVR